MHTAHSFSLHYFTRDFLLYLLSHTKSASPLVYIHAIAPGGFQDLSKHHGKKPRLVYRLSHLLTDSIETQEKPTPMSQCFEITVLYEISVQQSTDSAQRNTEYVFNETLVNSFITQTSLVPRLASTHVLRVVKKEPGTHCLCMRQIGPEKLGNWTLSFHVHDTLM